MKIVKKILLLFIAQFFGLSIIFGQETDSNSKVISKPQYETMCCYPACNKRTTPLNKSFLLDIGAFTPRMNSNDKIGFQWTFQKYMSKRFSAGIGLQQALITNSSNYGLALKDPSIQYVAIAICSEYNLIRKKRFEFNCLLLNGMVRNDLFSESLNVKNEKKKSDSDPDSISLFYALNRNYYISPAINFSVLLFPMKETYSCQLQLNVAVGYRQLIGKTMFGTLNEFSSPFAQVGLRLLMRNDRIYFSEWFNQKFKHKNGSLE